MKEFKVGDQRRDRCQVPGRVISEGLKKRREVWNRETWIVAGHPGRVIRFAAVPKVGMEGVVFLYAHLTVKAEEIRDKTPWWQHKKKARRAENYKRIAEKYKGLWTVEWA